MVMVITERHYFLFVLAIVYVIFAVIQDLKRREVANWLNFSLIAFALAYRGFYAFVFNDVNFFFFGVMGFVLFFLLAYLFYYSKVFAGGDAKLLMGIGAILPFESFSDLGLVGIVFIFLLFLFGTVWSLIYSLFVVNENRSKFINEFKKRMKNSKYFLIVDLILIILVLVLLNINIAIYIASAIVVIQLLYVYLRAVETCMIKLVKPEGLTEGDWILNDIRVGRGVVRKTVHGLSIRDIILLRKARKSIYVKEGVPFTPAFLLTLLFMAFFSGVLSHLILALQELVSLFFQL